MRWSLLGLACLVPPALTAQVPLGYLVTAEQPVASGEDGFAYLEPSTGVLTRVRMESRKIYGSARTVAVDPTDASGLFTSAGASVGGPPVLRFGMAGNLIRSISGGALRNFGLLERMAVQQGQLWFTFSSSATPGLYEMTFFNPQATQVATLANAYDIALLGGKVYVSSYLAATPSTVLEYDPVTKQTRTLGSSYPTFRGLGTYGPLLVAGTVTGDLLQIVPATGTWSVLRQTGKGEIHAIAEGPAALTLHFATTKNEVWALANLSRPVYVTANKINDIDLGVTDQGALLIHGAGCAGSNGTPWFDHVATPGLGKPLVLRIESARPQSAALLFFGASRQQLGPIPLPLDLTGAGMPGCRLYNDILIIEPRASDATGRAELQFTVPNQPPLLGLHLMGQYFVIDPPANALGLVGSDGAEVIVR